MTAALGFWPFDSSPATVAGVAAWLRATPAKARQLHRQDAVLERLAKGAPLPPSPAGVTLAQATEIHQQAVRSYMLVVAAAAQAYIDATEAGKLDKAAVRFSEIRRDGLGAITGGFLMAVVFVVAAAILGVTSVLWSYIGNKPKMLAEAANTDAKAKAVDSYLAWVDSYQKANPQAPPVLPDIFDPPTGAPTSAAGGVFANIGGMLTVGVALWVLSMLPAGGAK